MAQSTFLLIGIIKYCFEAVKFLTDFLFDEDGEEGYTINFNGNDSLFLKK
jgi:hypothetical protein